ncbi:hypothetical protein M569_17029 [Genlisea aurea]|uniref:Uncharacterized protein n=1 Tax=Genlisea aurea TaxID=192259 RepID=S8D506_9LAMI|nr:hypothetical protein M569_17029 [Genlisea aurea]
MAGKWIFEVLGWESFKACVGFAIKHFTASLRSQSMQPEDRLNFYVLTRLLVEVL